MEVLFVLKPLREVGLRRELMFRPSDSRTRGD